MLVDNRGTGGSAEQQCDLAPADRPSLYFQQIWPDGLLRECRQRLAQNANLSLYTSSIAADDLDELRAALGYPKLVLDGASYGTRLYLVYARRHPARVESIVLAGVAPPHFLIIPLEDAMGAQDAMTRLIAECRADTSCNAHFPQLSEHFQALVRRFDTASVSVPLENAKTRHVTSLPLSKEVFADRLRQLLYFPELAEYAPFIVDRAYRGDYGPLATMVDEITQDLRSSLPTDSTSRSRARKTFRLLAKARFCGRVRTRLKATYAFARSSAPAAFGTLCPLLRASSSPCAVRRRSS